MGLATLDHEYPTLFQPFGWGAITAQFEVGVADLSLERVESVHAVPFVGDECVVIRTADDQWQAPGGTVDPGETWREALVRELIEEAGAAVIAFEPFGWCECRRPDGHGYAVLMGWAQVDLVTAPTNPPGCEEVVEVATLPVSEAVTLLHAADQPELADIYRFAATIRANSCCQPA
jgi:8-oxo-dGTP diphosphatase